MNTQKCNIIRYALKCLSPFIVILTLVVLLMFIACNKEDITYPNPTINFITENGYVFSDSTLNLNQKIKVGLYAEAKSNVNLTHFNISLEKGSETITIDSGFHSKNLFYNKIIAKGIAEYEKWSFYVRDRDGRKSNTISIIFTLDTASTFGKIIQIPSLQLGAQNNSTTGSFYSISSDSIQDLEGAFANQSDINILYFYDLTGSDANTISSPGANIDNTVFPGTKGLTEWTNLKTTRFIYKPDISASEFSNCKNDSLILANTFEFSSGKRKAKNLAAGHIYSFVTEDGTKGLFRVTDISVKDTGTVKISLKRQAQ